MKTIALFGTSADPPTAGHQTILRWLSDHYDLVVVWASDNPFKDHQATLKRRTQMLRLLIEEIEPSRNNISLREELSDRRTLITVQKAREIWGSDAEFTVVIGSDLVSQIRKWYRIEDLLKQVKILIVPRPGYTIAQKDLEALTSLGGKYAIANLDAPPVSSTTYRQEKDSELITPAVQNYISQNHLYSAFTDSQN
ncbi:nicotinate-nucleotide adenylyltransferase [Pleurocapsales cyanobacterium LEGE 06147]|nr:nicotinate-nucleotide adenylyltransferase [Pleurocapsales cyanobacterium LEGE 06147]